MYSELSKSNRIAHRSETMICGADQDRTDDLLNAIQALSQLSYGPIYQKTDRSEVVACPATAGSYGPIYQKTDRSEVVACPATAGSYGPKCF